MKKTYVGLDAIKVHIDKSANVVTGQSQCWAQVTNKMSSGTCTTEEPGHVNDWKDFNDPNLPIYDPDDC